MSTDRTDHHPDIAPEREPGCGWREFAAARSRFFACLAAESASWRASRRLPTEPGERYDRAAAEGEGARSR